MPAPTSDSRSATTPSLRRALAAAVVAGAVFAIAGPIHGHGGSPPAPASEAGALVPLGDAMRASLAGSPDALAYVPGELIVRLDPRAPARADGGAGQGDATSVPDAAALADVLARYGVRDVRRVFDVYEDANGDLIDTAAASIERLRAARPEPGARRLPPPPEHVPALENYFLIELDRARTADEIEARMADLLSEDVVAAVQPNFVYHASAEPLPAVPTIPDDPYVSTDGASWSEGSFGNAFPDLYGLRNVHAFEAWSLLDTNGDGAFGAGETAPGQGVVVAVIDTGLDLAHPEVASRLFVNPGEIPDDGIDNDGNGRIDDLSGWDFIDNDAVPEDGNGHGSHVAGTIAAGADNAEGIAGVAAHARILPVKGLTDDGFGTTTGLAAAVLYAAMTGADITSNSWGSAFSDGALEAAFDFAEASGVLSIAAAGNSARSQIAAPARFENVMAIAAVDHGNVLAGFSNWGVGLDLCAPGVGVLSLSANDHDNRLAELESRRVGDRYLLLSGTSMAAPHASGVAALLMSLHPAESAAEIRGRMLAAATPIEAQNPGREGGLGAGQVDAFASAVAVPAPLLQVTGLGVGAILPGETTGIEVSLRNFWAPASNVHVSLTSDDAEVVVTAGEQDFGALATGATATRGFEIELAADVALGREIDLLLTITADGTPAREHAFSVRRSLFVNEESLADIGRFPLFVVGATFGDYDSDGLQDMGIGSYLERIRLYRQLVDGTFETDEPAGSERGRFPVFADMDGDGLLDMLAVGSLNAGVRLAVNVGNGQFEVLPESSGFRIPSTSPVTSVTPIDLDADGRLDVLVGLLAFFQDDQGVFRNVVALRNNGDLTFTDVWAETGLPRTVGGRQFLTVDWNGDGLQDLLVLRGIARRVELYRGRWDGRFEDATDVAFPDGLLTCANLVAGECDLFSAAAAGDYDNDGDTDLALVIQNNVDSVEPKSAIVLLENDGTGVYADVTAAAGDLATVSMLSGIWGTTFFDLENDGDLDLVVPIDVLLLGSPVRQPEETIVFLRNDGGGSFTHVSDVALPPDAPVASLVLTVGDYDGDGAQDILAPVMDVAGLVGGLLRNLAAEQRSWLAVELDGVTSPVHGYGAQVTVVAGGRTQTRQVQLAPTEPWRVHFGLGDATSVDALEVRWPSGVVGLQHGLGVDQVVRIDEATPCPELPGGQCPTVTIDVDPKSDDNPINPQSKKLVNAVIHGAASFDVTRIDRTRTFFGRGRGTPEHASRGHLTDVDSDGFVDLITHYRVDVTGVQDGDDEVCLRGQLLDRTPFSGCVFITTPANGIGSR